MRRQLWTFSALRSGQCGRCGLLLSHSGAISIVSAACRQPGRILEKREHAGMNNHPGHGCVASFVMTADVAKALQHKHCKTVKLQQHSSANLTRSMSAHLLDTCIKLRLHCQLTFQSGVLRSRRCIFSSTRAQICWTMRGRRRRRHWGSRVRSGMTTGGGGKTTQHRLTKSEEALSSSYSLSSPCGPPKAPEYIPRPVHDRGLTIGKC